MGHGGRAKAQGLSEHFQVLSKQGIVPVYTYVPVVSTCLAEGQDQRQATYTRGVWDTVHYLLPKGQSILSLKKKFNSRRSGTAVSHQTLVLC